MRLGSFAGITFGGDAEGEIWETEEVSPSLFRAPFSCDRGDGVLELSMAPDGWVKAELLLGGAMIFRAWIEDPYEEKEGWPDGADGIGEAPLRISKRGSWLSLDVVRFPGVTAGKDGYFTLEETNR
ncbi:MAG TPA: hypothetical protein VG942_16335 [Hyphomonadaceae bacterium]|nr:hypothetical protein [Hyphomonadaceae bacterium]